MTWEAVKQGSSASSATIHQETAALPKKQTDKVYISNLLGPSIDEDFIDFDLTEIQEVMISLRDTNVIDIAHCELLQSKALAAADILSEYLGRINKSLSYLESKLNSAKNKASLEYSSPGKTTAEMRKWAATSDPEVEKLEIKIAYIKGSKVLLDKKYDLLIKSHFHYKEISSGLRRVIGSGVVSY